MTFLRDFSDGIHVAQAKHELHGKNWAMSRCGIRLPITHATNGPSTCATCQEDNVRAVDGVVHRKRNMNRSDCGLRLRSAGVSTNALVTCLLCLGT